MVVAALQKVSPDDFVSNISNWQNILDMEMQEIVDTDI